MLNNKVKVNAADKYGWTALHYAVHKGFENRVSLLLKHDANQFLRDKHGRSALNVAEKLLNDKEPHRQRILDMLRLC